ncbi:MAG: methyltransferase domain-containing protein [Chloroflexota bacterium]|nr:methyltransferase domain-containing protein [Chloroflexota bacterium]
MLSSNRTVDRIPRCDYEGSRYQEDFWTAERSYEDLAERIALRRLLPPWGRRIVEIGAGAGRLGDLYEGYETIYLVDYAKSQLEQAHARWGHDPRFVFVQGDIYALPFPTGYFDTVVTVRVLHHVKALALALGEVARVTAPRGFYVTEFANKRNLKAVLRYLLGKGKAGENPFSLEPFEFVPLNVDYHPHHVRQELEDAGFVVMSELGASFFRLPWLKQRAPASLLARLDGWLQRIAAPLRLSPSIFLQNYLPKNQEDQEAQWRCPICRSINVMSTGEGVTCNQCGRAFPLQDGIYLFRSDSV